MIPELALPMLRGSCLVLRIIVLGLATGVGVFAIIAVVNQNGQFTWEFPPAQFVTQIFLLFGIMALAGSFIVPAILSAKSPTADPKMAPTGDEAADLALRVAAAMQTRTIVGCALLEGGAFANLMGVFTDGYGPGLVLAGILLTCIVLRFPTWDRYLQRIENGMRRVS